MSWPRSLLWVKVRDTNALNARADGDQAPAFLTLQSLATFPGATLAVAIVWAFFNKVVGVGDHSRNLVVMISSGVIGLVLLVWGWRSLKTRGEKLGGVVIAIINTMYLVLAVLGIDITLLN
jgi:hypothetical protein